MRQYRLLEVVLEMGRRTMYVFVVYGKPAV